MKIINKFGNFYSLVALAVLFAFSNVGAQNAFVDSLMKAGNAAYTAKNFEKAIDNYEKIIDEGYESPALYYNLGNAYYKIGALGKAILNYERALALNPSDEDAKYNLKIANARIVDKINAVPKFFLTEWKDSLLKLFSPSALALITSVLFAAFLLFLFLFRYGKTAGTRKSGFVFASVFFALFVLSALLYYGKAKQIETEKYGIILAKEVTVRVSPDDNAKAAFIVHEGTKVLVEDKVGNWADIKLPDGKKGWAPKDTFELIDN